MNPLLKLFCLVAITLLSGNSVAQKQFESQSINNTTFDKGNFSKDQWKELKKATKSLKEGDELYDKGRAYFKMALIEYLKANKFNPNNAKLNFKIGRCYLEGTIYKLKSISYFEKAAQLDSTAYPDFYFYLGSSYQINSEWDRAIEAYNDYAHTLTGMENNIHDVRKKINQCKLAKKLMANPERVKIENIGEAINTPYPEYGAVISADESVMVFTSRRPNTTGKEKDPERNDWYEDLYITNLIDNNWTKPQNMGKPTNDDGHDASISLSADGQRLLMYRHGDIYECDLKGDKWLKPQKLGKNINTDSHEPSACFSYDGRHLYFVSDKEEDNQGGYDIYVSEWEPKRKRWGKPTNLGPAINTKYNEDGVFMHPDGKTLYFSSKGHPGMGGYDIFYSVFENGAWQEPINLGYPINTPDDDIFFVLGASGEHGYYSSFKTDGFGQQDLYKITWLPPEEKKINSLSVLKGVLLDHQTLDPINATIEIYSIEDGSKIATYDASNPDGSYEISLPPGKKYGMTILANGHLLHAENFTMPPTPQNNANVLERNIKLRPLSPDLVALRAKATNDPYTLMGFLIDDQTLTPIQATIEVINLEDKSVFKTITSNSETGEYAIKLPKNGNFAYRVLSKGRLIYAENLPAIDESKNTLNRDINLQRLAPIKTSMGRKDEKDLTLVKGFFRDYETLAPIEATIEVYDLEDGSLVATFTSNSLTGKYLVPLPAGKLYAMKVTADGHLFHSENFEVLEGGGFRSLNKNINLKEIKEGSKIVLNNIFFDFGKHTLNEKSKTELENILFTLIENPKIKVEISGHTDNVSSATFNQKLSEKRAKSVVDHLIAEGVKEMRLTYKGYGEKHPIASNDMEEGRAKNRRTEFKIIKAE